MHTQTLAYLAESHLATKGDHVKVREMSISTLQIQGETATEEPEQPWELDLRFWDHMLIQKCVRVPCDGDNMPLRGDALMRYGAGRDIHITRAAKEEVFDHTHFGMVTGDNKEYVDRWYPHDLVVLSAKAVGSVFDFDKATKELSRRHFDLAFAETCLPLCEVLSVQEIRAMGFQQLIFLNRPFGGVQQVPRILLIRADIGECHRIDVCIWSRLRVTQDWGLVVWNRSDPALATAAA